MLSITRCKFSCSGTNSFSFTKTSASPIFRGTLSHLSHLSHISHFPAPQGLSNRYYKYTSAHVYGHAKKMSTTSVNKIKVLSKTFLEAYKKREPPFGFNGLGELVYRRTYARKKDSGEHEVWWETVERVVEGTFHLQNQWLQSQQLEKHSPEWIKRTAEEMYDCIYNMKFLPPGRGLWAMGTPITEEKGLFAALNNCAFISTESLHNENSIKSKPFSFLMDAAMLGVGVGFDVKGGPKKDANGDLVGVKVMGSKNLGSPVTIKIDDSREGWVDSVSALINSHMDGTNSVIFDYTNIRPEGTLIKTFGGSASGPGPLMELHKDLHKIFMDLEGKFLSVIAICDIMNLIGRCVVSGNVRRAAEISFGDPNSEEYLNLKNYKINPHRQDFGWASNNSVLSSLGMDYTRCCDRILDNGEPGFAWLENMQSYSRMKGEKDNKDYRALGGNPCLEQTLESYELCCLVETFPNRHESQEDFLKTLDLALLYAKTVTLGKTHWPESNNVMSRNRRIGCSMSGIAQFITTKGIHELKDWCENGYSRLQSLDTKYSEMFAVRNSIKLTSVKPSGTVSLLAGATPGVHYPHSRFCIRRVRIASSSELIPALRDAGYPIEPAVENPNLAIVSFAVDNGDKIRSVDQISMWEQLSLAAFMQKHWADNQVSCTVTFNPQSEGKDLAHCLNYFQYQLKGISFLPLMEAGAYPQMPYESITEEKYFEMSLKLKQMHLEDITNDVTPDKYCDNDSCDI